MPREAPRAILPAIRLRTTDAHRALGAQINFPAVCQSAVSYEELLADLWGFYTPFESVLENIHGWEKFGFKWAERTKAGLLHRDLIALGVDETKFDGLPKCLGLPRPATLTEAFGCVYVLENATLDGAQILIGLKRSPIPVEARNFLNSYEGDIAGKWREFCRTLDQLQPGEIEFQSLVRNALHTFECLSAWLEVRSASTS